MRCDFEPWSRQGDIAKTGRTRFFCAPMVDMQSAHTLASMADELIATSIQFHAVETAFVGARSPPP
jgi:hypothetical protein